MKTEEITEDYPEKEDIENAQALAREVSPELLAMFEAEALEEEEDAD